MASAKFQFSFADEQESMNVDFDRIQRAVTNVFEDAGFVKGSIEIVTLASEPMRQMNVEYLGHDYPTDVLAFPLEVDQARKSVDAEIVICPDVAIDLAKDYNWPPEDELLLYAIHGALHIVGYDDHAPEDAPIMHAKEREYLARVGVDGAHSRDAEE